MSFRFSRTMFFERVAIFALLVLLLSIGMPASAGNDLDSIGILPYTAGTPGSRPWFVYDDIKPGAVLNDSVLVSNGSSQVVDVLVYPVDAKNAADGGYAPEADDAPVTDMGRWIKLDSSKVTLKPGEQKRVNFSITVPEKVTVGDHAATILVHRETSAPDGSKIKDFTKNSAINVVVRMGARVYLNIQGPIVKKFDFKAIALKKDTAGKSFFDFDIENTGNVRLNFTANVELTDDEGKVVQRFDKNLSEVLPFSKVNVSRFWDEPILGNGSLTAKAVVFASGIEESQTRQTTFEMDRRPGEKTILEIIFGSFEGRMLLGVIAVLILIVLIQSRRNRRK